MSLCIIAIFKNESCIMKEWIEHYIKEGVDHFFLIDNDSSDDYSKILNPYIYSKRVTLIIDPTRYDQVNLYNKHFLEKSKLYEWVIVCDLDEFIYSRKEFKTIKEYLNTLDKSISQVHVQWKMFGSNGLIEQPESVIKSFTKRVDYDTRKTQGVHHMSNGKYSLNKCIVRTSYLKALGIHNHALTQDKRITSDNSTSNLHSQMSITKIDESILKESYLNLNHYAIQSESWFMKVKATRGDIKNKLLDTRRNIQYFKAYDINDKEDLELSVKKY